MPLPLSFFAPAPSPSASSSSLGIAPNRGAENTQQTDHHAQEMQIQGRHVGTPVDEPSAPLSSNHTPESALSKAWRKYAEKKTKGKETKPDEKNSPLDRTLAHFDSSIASAMRDFHNKVPENLHGMVLDCFCDMVVCEDDNGRQEAVFNLINIFRGVLENQENDNGVAAFKNLLKICEIIQDEGERADAHINECLRELFKLLGKEDRPEIFQEFAELARVIENKEIKSNFLDQLRIAARKYLFGDDLLIAFDTISEIVKSIIPDEHATIDSMKASIKTIDKYDDQRLEALCVLSVMVLSDDNMVKIDVMQELIEILPFIQEDHRLAFLGGLERLAETITDRRIKLEVIEWINKARALFLKGQSDREQAA